VAVVVEKTVPQLEAALTKLGGGETAEPVMLVVTTQSPAVGLGDVNSMGIKERLGVGRSTYFHSIPGRVYNVELAASRINGTVVKPGEEFSFNKAVGEVSGATGYKPAYIIANGRTELGDGGGVCQDSTTAFRAALDAGLPITSRRGHAYRVGYYEQDAKPGLDATVYAPSTDFKFLNDTPAYLLIQTIVDSPNRSLTYVIYGTSDGRTSAITDHVVWGATPPPPDIYQDDPSLPAGTIKQVDWKAPGAKAKFIYTVTRNGEVITNETYTTNYKPWASIYLRGTGQ
jgi:vancomycin resistance protein YoaR